jgi:AraC-like DNA-binding protein
MEYVEIPAPPPLDDIVRCFWFLRGDFPPSGESQTVVADGRLEIILHLAEPFSRVDGDGPMRQADALVSGQLTAPIRLRGNGVGDVVGIRFRTSAAASVLRLPLADLTNRVEPLDAVSAALASSMQDAVRRHDQPRARVAALALALGRRIVASPDPLAAIATSALATPTIGRIEALAHSLGTTPRTLERRVIMATGLPPATLRRVMRFRRAFMLLESAPRGTWTEVATRSGYADQAHLIRDFRQFAGAAPTDFFQAAPDLARAIMAGDPNPT